MSFSEMNHIATYTIERARRRTVNFVLGMIALVWLLSCIICLPPLIGWNDWPDDWTDNTPCELTQEKGYVIYSAMGSFYIPLAVIIFVYFKIFQVRFKSRLLYLYVCLYFHAGIQLRKMNILYHTP